MEHIQVPVIVLITLSGRIYGNISGRKPEPEPANKDSSHGGSYPEHLMNLQSGSTISNERSGTHGGSEIRLQGAWLILARVAWVVIALLALGLIVASLPSYFTYLHIANAASFYGPQLTPGDVRELQRLGLSLDFYARVNISMFLITLLVCVSIGIIL